MNTAMYKLTEEFRRDIGFDMYRKNIDEIVKLIRVWVEVHRESILLAWFAEHDFSPSKAVLVEEQGFPHKTYIRECTAEEGERAQTAANTARQASDTYAQIAARMRELASEPCKAGFVPISTETLNEWARQLLPC